MEFQIWPFALFLKLVIAQVFTKSEQFESSFFSSYCLGNRNIEVLYLSDLFSSLTLPRMDFFLIPQNTNQGTVNPVYYRILHDGIPEFTMDHYQILAFKLCYTYYNWTVSILINFIVFCKYAGFIDPKTSQSLFFQIKLFLQSFQMIVSFLIFLFNVLNLFPNPNIIPNPKVRVYLTQVKMSLSHEEKTEVKKVEACKSSKEKKEK